MDVQAEEWKQIRARRGKIICNIYLKQPACCQIIRTSEEVLLIKGLRMSQ